MLAIFSVAAFAVAALATPIPDGPVLGVTLGESSGSATNATKPDPSQVTIQSISYGGSGCPQNSVGQFISDDKETFTLIFDDMVASIGGGVASTETRKNCQINLNLHYPTGFQYSVLSTTFRGYASLDAGVSGTQSATYYFSGSNTQATATQPFKGPVNADYATPESIPFASAVWAPCGASLPLNINTQVRLTSTKSTAQGLLTQDSLDGKITYVVGLSWRQCPTN